MEARTAMMATMTNNSTSVKARRRGRSMFCSCSRIPSAAFRRLDFRHGRRAPQVHLVLLIHCRQHRAVGGKLQPEELGARGAQRQDFLTRLQAPPLDGLAPWAAAMQAPAGPRELGRR